MKIKIVLVIFAILFILSLTGTVAAEDVNYTANNSSMNVSSNNTVAADHNDTDTHDLIISGTVNQCGTTDSFPGVNVTVYDLNGTALASTITDNNGFYSTDFLSNKTTFKVIASFAGHIPDSKEVTVNLNPNGSSDHNLYATVNLELGPFAVYVNHEGQTLQVINATTNTQSGQMGAGLGGYPEDVAITPDGKTAVIACFYGDTHIIDITDPYNPISLGTVTTPNIEDCYVVITPNGKYALVTGSTNSGYNNIIYVIDIAARTVVNTYVDTTNVVGLAVSPDGQTVIAANYWAGQVRILTMNPATGVLSNVGTVAVLGRPISVAISPDGRTALISTESSNDVYALIINGVGSVSGISSVNSFGMYVPNSITFSPDGTRAYVTLYGTPSQVAVLNVFGPGIATDSGIRIPLPGINSAGSVGHQITVSPDGTTAYTTLRASNTVAILNLATNSIIGVLAAGSMPLGIAFPTTSGNIYVDGVNGNDANNGLTPTTAKRTINAGISAAFDGWNVNVFTNTIYNENVFVNKDVTLKSYGLGSVALNGIINIIAPGSGASVEGFNIIAGPNGVIIGSASNIELKNTIIAGFNGIQLTGTCSNITLDGLTISNSNNHAIFLNSGNYNNILINNTQISNVAQGIYVSGIATNTTINNVNIIGSIGQAILFPDGSVLINININNTNITNCQSTAIESQNWAEIQGITISNTTITHPAGYGIRLIGNNRPITNIIIQNTTVTQAGSSGIHVEMSDGNSQNLNITNTTSSNNVGCGIYASLRGIINITNNTLNNNGDWGLHITGISNPNTILSNNKITNNVNGIYIQNINGLILTDTSNNIHNNGGYAYYLENADNTTMENITLNNSQRSYNYAVYAVGCDNLLLQNLNINNNSLQAIWIDGIAINTTINNVNITNSIGQAILLRESSQLTNVIINNTQIIGCKSTGIEKENWSELYGITIQNTAIINPQFYGIRLVGNNRPLTNVVIDNVTINQSGSHGIHIEMSDGNSQNLTITNTTSSNNAANGIYATIRGITNIQNNTLQNNGDWGLHITGINNPTLTLQNNTITNNVNGIYIQNINGLILTDTSNNIHNNGGYAYYLENADNITMENITLNNSQRSYNYAVYAVGCDNLLLQNLNINNNSLQAIWIDGTATNTTINNVNIINSIGQAILLRESSQLTNVIINNTQITNCQSTAIESQNWAEIQGITINNITIIHPAGYGIRLIGNNRPLTNVVINNVAITQAGSSGIHIEMNDQNSQNLTITNTTSSNNVGCGIYASLRGIINITNNILNNNGDWGLHITGINNPNTTLNNNTITSSNNGIYLQGVNGGIFRDNQLINNTGDDLYAAADTNNSFTRLTLGLTHPTTVSFSYLNGIIMNGVESAPADPTGWLNIGKYVDIQGLGSTTVNLTVYYAAADLAGKNETGLKMFHYGTSWSELPQPNGVSTTEQYVYADGISSFSTFAPLTVKLSTSLAVLDVIGIRGGSVDLTANLTGGDGTPLVGKTVYFSIDGTDMGTADTDGRGIATFCHPVSENAGVHTILAEFRGDDQYLTSQDTSTLTVKISTGLAVGNVTGVNGGTANLTATLTDEKGNPVDGENVTFNVNGTDYNATTDASGIATLNYTITETAGIYTINAVFAGDDNYILSSGTGTLTVNTKDTTLIVGNVTGVNGKTVSLTATLTDADGPVSGKTVTFNVKGIDYNRTTDASGIATLNYVITETAGVYTVTASFVDGKIYANSTGTGNLTVNTINTAITVNNATGYNGKTVNLTAALKDADGNPISGKTVTFSVNGTDRTAITDANGVATLSYKLTKAGVYTVNASFTDGTIYANSSGSGNLTVSPAANLYIKITASNNNPKVGEKFLLTYKLGNYGPDAAENVTITFKLPEGLNFVKVTADTGNCTYDPATRTVTWILGSVPVGDPYLYLTVQAAAGGTYTITPTIDSDTYNWNSGDAGIATINVEKQYINGNSDNNSSGNTVNAASTISMQETGLPINYLILAIFMVISSLVTSKKF